MKCLIEFESRKNSDLRRVAHAVRAKFPKPSRDQEKAQRVDESRCSWASLPVNHRCPRGRLTTATDQSERPVTIVVRQMLINNRIRADRMASRLGNHLFGRLEKQVGLEKREQGSNQRKE